MAAKQLPTSNKRKYSGKKPPGPVEEMIRLNRYIALSGVCSRRDADQIILRGDVTVNGKIVNELGTKVRKSDEIKYKGKKLNAESLVYILLNKPKGYVTTVADPHAEKTVIDLVRNACNERIFPVGRLDKGTTGVLLLTNDGDLAGKLTHPRYKKKKIYHVWLDRDITKSDMLRLTEGIEIDGELIAADSVAWPDTDDKTQVGMELHSGQNRVVRRMFETMNYKVRKLDRVYFAGLTKKNLPRGKYRFLTESEITMLKRGMSK
ncbi:MAG: pseudouridine synthase [Bacteroidales bacterium]